MIYAAHHVWTHHPTCDGWCVTPQLHEWTVVTISQGPSLVNDLCAHYVWTHHLTCDGWCVTPQLHEWTVVTLSRSPV